MTAVEIAALIVAAGRGTRMAATLPKQYHEIGGKAVLTRSIERLLEIEEVGAVRVVTNPADDERYQAAVAGIADDRLLPPVTGGATRSQSVRLGLQSFAGAAPARILIHDAARPFVATGDIRRVITALDDTEGAALALPVADALWASQQGLASRPVSRDGIWRAQTPQGFHFDRILDAHRQNDRDMADDIAVACRAGMNVRLIEGSEGNFKITTPADLERARAVFQR